MSRNDLFGEYEHDRRGGVDEELHFLPLGDEDCVTVREEVIAHSDPCTDPGRDSFLTPFAVLSGPEWAPSGVAPLPAPP